MNIPVLSCDSFGPRLTREVQSMRHCFRYKAQSTAMTKTIRASEMARPGSLLDGRVLKMRTRHQCRSGTDRNAQALCFCECQRNHAAFFGKIQRTSTSALSCFSPPSPAWGAPIWPDITRSPVRETSSSGACPPGLLLMHSLCSSSPFC